MRAWLVGTLGVFLTLCGTLVAGRAEAIPPFARAYSTQCATCHTAVTRRNDFGDVFKRMGYHWPGPGGADIRSQRVEPTEMKGFAPFESWLPSSIPLGVIGTMSAAYTSDPQAESVTLGSPSLNLVLGAALSDHISVFGTWGGSGPPNELYLHFGKLFGRPELNFRIGRFEQHTTLFKNNQSQYGRFQLSSGSLNGHTVGQSRLGAEVSGAVADRLFYSVGVVQNAGIGSPVDVYYHLNYKLGGIDYLGEEPDIDFDDPTWTDDVMMTIGHWGYLGKVSTDAGMDVANVRRLGLDLKFEVYGFSLWAGAMIGLDQDIASDKLSLSLSWFGEAAYAVFPWLQIGYIYQYRDAEVLQKEEQTHGAAAVFVLAENVRTRLRFSFSDDGVDNEAVDLQLLFGL